MRTLSTTACENEFASSSTALMSLIRSWNCEGDTYITTTKAYEGQQDDQRVGAREEDGRGDAARAHPALELERIARVESGRQRRDVSWAF